MKSFEDNLKSNNKNNKKKKGIIIVLFLLVLCFLFFGFRYVYNNSFFVNKIDSSKDFVYTSKKNKNSSRDDGSYDYVPKVNIVGNDASKVNNEILDVYKDVVQHDEYDYQYEFNRSEKILSLKITYSYFLKSTDSEVTRFFNTYNFDLKTGKLIDDVELLSMYGITPKELNEFMGLKFRKYYNELIKLGYYTSKTCDYNCFLKNRGITATYTDDVYLYVDNGSLVLYKFYYKNSEYEEEYYLVDETYRFLIKKK